MRHFAIVLLGLINLVSAQPTFLPLTHTTSLTSDTRVSTNGRALDSADVARRDRVNLVNEYVRSNTAPLQGQQLSLLDNDNGVPPVLTSSAPLGADGRVVDTPEVAAARAAHAAAHANEKINLANEAARSNGDVSDLPGTTENSAITAPEAVIGPDGRVLDTPEVAAARAAHTAAHVNERINLANEAARSSDVLARVVDGSLIPLVLGNGVVAAALVPVGPEGRPLDTPEAVVSNQKLANDVKSVDALAVAGPALAYGRLIY